MLFIFLSYFLLVLLLYYFYKYGTKYENFFVERGLKHHKPVFLLGNMLKPVLKQMSLFDHIKNITRHFHGEKLMGFFEFRNPIVLILEPELVKVLTVKEFDSFVDHREILTEKADPICANTIFFMRGQKWRDMRSTLSPAFTGSKMRLMCSLMVEICEQMVDFLKTEASEKGPQIHEAKTLLSRLTSDIIGTCAFGIKVDSLKNENNNFYTTAKKIFTFQSASLHVKFALYQIFPKLMIWLRVPFFKESDMMFLKHLVVDTMKTREEQNIYRPDMIQLMMEARKGNLTHTDIEKDSAGFATVEESEIGLTGTTQRKQWTDNEICAQSFVFFIAGFEAIATLLSFVIYELMVNPEVQEKLYQEFKECQTNLKGKSLDYDCLKKLKYLDMVVSEILRKWPPSPFTDRVCNKDYTLKYDDKEYQFCKGDKFYIPIVAYHYNPDYFPNPDKFDPERFNDENKDFIKPDTFLPFGSGPRNCVGSRFALMKLKAIVYYLIVNFKVEVTEKTQIPLELLKSITTLQSSKGVHARFCPRM